MAIRAQASRYELLNRYQFKGRLVMQTALHIGGGRVTLRVSDSPVVLTPEEIPFIPGSSFKGALRSTVEKLVPDLPGLYSCGLIELSDEDIEERKKNGMRMCPTVRQRDVQRQRRNASPEEQEKIKKEIYDTLCDTCQLFGSPFAASRINVSDLYMPEEEWSGIIQVRDGVVIDRDSEKAKDRLKYDFEVVPASATFNLEITLENATPQDLQLICVGLSEFVHGFGVIGGKRSRGLGVCLLQDLRVSSLELTGLSESDRNKRLRDYLLKRQFSDEISGPAFLEKHIDAIFA